MANNFSSMPYIPYKIIAKLLENENLWKLLKYDTYDCLQNANLTDDEKLDLLWSNDKSAEDCRVFLTNTKSDIMTDSRSVLQCYRNATIPMNEFIATVCYRFDILFGAKVPMVDYNGLPCNRGDVIETEILSTINGKDVAGAGFLTFDRERTTMCRSDVGIGNKNTFTGVSFVMATTIGDNVNECN